MRTHRTLLRVFVWAALSGTGAAAAMAAVTPVPGDPLKGDGSVKRTLLTYRQLFSNETPSSPVDDFGGFGRPADAAQPTQSFEGTLTLVGPARNGGFKVLRQRRGGKLTSGSAWEHLAPFSFQFVQNGSYLIPARQGLVITGSPAWNYIVGPGRVWREDDDRGYMRASFPFALVERNANCVHNGEMTFLFSNSNSPNISNVRYQITQETCLYFKFDMWGQIAATYTPGKVAGSKVLKNAEAAEIAHRLPTRSIGDVAKDYPNSGFKAANLTAGFKSPEDITAYGMYIDGVNYVSDCPTRYGTYAFCDDMRLPSYSLAKSSLAGLALMWLGKQYGPGVNEELIRNYVPQYVDGGDWTRVTFDNTSDMATGNFISSRFEADENSASEWKFLDAESYSEKIADAFAPFPHQAPPGTTWVYQTSATFILTQAMDNYLKKRRGNDADIFDAVRDSIYRPLQMSAGSMTTLRTGNSRTGRPFGGYGLFFVMDDVAKLGRFLNNRAGAIDATQILDPTRLQRTLFRTAHPSTLGLPVPDWVKTAVPDTFRYNGLFWAKHMTTAEFPQYPCDFWVPFMSGYGGITVLLLPDGVTYYVFSDNNEFVWYPAVNEIGKLAPMCRSTGLPHATDTGRGAGVRLRQR